MGYQLVLFLACFFLVEAKWIREMENSGLFQGDIRLRPDQLEAIKNGHSPFGSVIGFRWPGGIVPYVIDSSIGDDGKNAVLNAIKDYHTFTCLKFHQRNREREYLQFTNGGGCSSPVGYNNPQFTSNGVNVVTLGPGCRTKGVAMHEMGHSIGLYHEQSRQDRDQHVQILLHNLYNSKMAYNFNKIKNINSLGTAYDYMSMMHYGRTAFGCDKYGRNCRETIKTIDSTKQHLIGQRNGFSQGDIDQINKMYNCKTTPPSGECVDKDTNCAYWAGIGECSKNQDWMLKNCQKSCAHVNGDKDASCPQWAKTGECQKNPTYMLVNCKKSCDVC